MTNHSRKECWLWSHSRPGLSPSAAIPGLCDFDQSCFISVSLNSGKHGLRSAQMYLACSGCSANTNILSCSRTHQEVPRRSSFGFQHPIHILFPPTLGALKPARLQKGRGLFIPITFPSSLHPGSWPKAREPLLPALRFQVKPTYCSEPWLPRLADGEAECWWILVASACPASLPSFVHNFLLGSVPLSFSVHMGTCSRTDW